MAFLALSGSAEAVQIEVQEYLGYMWKSVTEINFGDVALGASTTYYKNNKPLLVLAEGIEVDAITIECSDETVSAIIDGDKNLFLSITPGESGEYSKTVILKAEGAESCELNVKASAMDLSASTISGLKEMAVKEGQRYSYTGEAIVTHVEGNAVWASDETGGVMLICPKPVDLSAGDVITFNGIANSASREWESFLQTEISLVKHFNWRAPIPEIMGTEFSAQDYGKFIRLPKVKFTRQVSTESYGTVYNTYYFEDDDNNEYVVHAYTLESPYFEYDGFEKNEYYDLTGVIYP